MLFLGEWCRLHSRRERWSRMAAEVMPYHWDDRAKYQADYHCLLEVHERVLSELAGKLNRIHGVAHEVRYWRILLGPWLGLFVQMVFDRWACIERSVLEYGASETIVLSGSEEAFVPNDTADFHQLFLADEWNHHIYSSILRRFPQVACTTVAREPVAALARKAHGPTPWLRTARRSAAAWVRSALSTLSRDHDAFLLTSYLPTAEELRLHWRMKQIPFVRQSVPPVEVAVDPGHRRWTLEGRSESAFEGFVRELIPAHLPTVFLEGYGRLISQTRGLGWPRKPKVIFTSNSAWADDLFKAWAAERVAEGAPLVIGQHGGHLGAGRWSFVEDHDVAICDRYLSWGWTDPPHTNIRPTCQLKARRPLGVNHAGKPGALLVTDAIPRYSYWMYSSIVARQWLDYFEDQLEFVAALPARIRDAVTVRLYRDDYGWGQVARWRERAPGLRLDAGASNMDDLLRESRLYISTYNATTYLESLTMDIPTVIFWNEQHWELRDSALEFFEDLRHIGIFHATPESAARHIAQVWDDVDAWWSSPKVREVLARFKDRYCRVVDDVAAVVEVALLEVVESPRVGSLQ